MPEIFFSSGSMADTSVELPEDGLVMGRASDVDLVINDIQVSSRHVEIRPRDGEWYVIDLGSANGTSVNGHMIDEVKLNSGDVVEIGDTRFMFEAGAIFSDASAIEEPVKRPPSVKANRESVKLIQSATQKTKLVKTELQAFLPGQQEVVDQILAAMICGEHVLLTNLPGTGKDLLVNTLASLLDVDFRHIRLFEDTTPADIIGPQRTAARGPEDEEYQRPAGPLFCNFLMADDICMATPRTQALLLKSMHERTVTVGEYHYPMEDPFFLLATQGPADNTAANPLSEDQLDQFMLNVRMAYPAREEEEGVIDLPPARHSLLNEVILTKEELGRISDVVASIPLTKYLARYVVRIVRATRPENDDSPSITKSFVSVGAGPRAGQYIVMAARALAMLEGRISTDSGDIRRAAPPVLRHRITTNAAAATKGITPEQIVTSIVNDVMGSGSTDSTKKKRPTKKFVARRKK